jgi:hypothetical protein
MKRLMQKIFKKLILTIAILIPVFTQAQSTAVTMNAYDLKMINKQIDNEQKDFEQFLQKLDFDANIKNVAKNFVMNDVDELQDRIQQMKNNTTEEKLKALRSLQFFVNALKGDLNRKKFSVYKIPVTLHTYQRLLPMVMQNQPIYDHIGDLSWRSLQLLSNSFFQFSAGKYLENLSTFRRVKSSPQYILSFLENNSSFVYKDSLLGIFASQFPNEILDYVKSHKNNLTDHIRTSTNPFLKQILGLATNINASEVVPFTEQLVKGDLTVDSILNIRRNVTAYYQLLVNTIIENNKRPSSVHYQKALWQALNEKTMTFYIKEINNLHSAPDAVRFASVKSLRPQDLYYIIISAEQDMYTSTYLGLYRRLMDQLKSNTADTIFNLVRYDQSRKFLRIAANYNTLLDFFKRMPPTVAKDVLHYFVAEINMETIDENELITEVMDVAGAFLAISQDAELSAIVKEELRNRLEKYKKENLYHGVRVFQILNQAYDAIAQKDDANNLRNIYNYESIGINQLRNKKDTVNEVVLFYGDEDGLNSFRSFMNVYTDTTKWKLESNSSYIIIRGQQGQPVNIYASLPLDMEEKMDLAAQDTMFMYLKENNIQPSILIHRGHSYHLENTLKRLQPYTKLAVLGSCGGYNNIKQIVSANPDIQIIASKQVGAMIINDPMLDAINQQIVAGKDLHWEKFWDDLGNSFKSNAAAYKLFGEYVPPYKNVGVFVYRLYNLDQ